MIAAGLTIQVLILVSSVYFLGGRALFFLDFISLLFDSAMLFAVLLSTGAVKPFARGWVFILSKKHSGTRGEFEECADSWLLAIHILLAAGVTGFLIGMVLMLANLNEPAHIGQNLAPALISIFYSTVCILLFLLPGRYMLIRMMKKTVQK